MRNALAMLILVPAACVCACGGNVVVDTASKMGAGGVGTSGAGGFATVGSATGGVATIGSSSSGPADGPVSSSSSGTVTVTSASSVSATSTTSSVSSTASTSSTGGPVGACANAPDEAALAAHMGTLDQDLFNCTVTYLGNPGGSAMCFTSKEGMSLACAWCFADEGQCGAMACENVCSGGVANPPCLACLKSHCDSAFTSCSGIPFPG